MAGSNDAADSSSRAFDYDRTVALSDGVFAIALTLLVLTISFPGLHGAARHQLGTELRNRLPQLFSYALSFAVIARLWVRHHAFFRGLRRIDGRLAGLNLVYLALIAFLPYPTRLVGEYGSETVSVVIYAAAILFIALVSSLMRVHASRAALGAATDRSEWRAQATVSAVFLISIPLAIVISPSAAEWSWAAAVVALPLARARGSNRRRDV